MRSGLPPLFAWLALAGLPQALPAAPPASLPTLAVRVLPGTDSAIVRDLEHVRLVKGTEPATLQLDLAHRRVLNGAGRIVAGADAVRPLYLQSVIDKWRYAAFLDALARAHPQEVRSQWGEKAGALQTAPRPWVAGTTATFVVLHVMPSRDLLFFGIGPSGDIYLLNTQVVSSDAEGQTRVATATAIPPFGAEHLVAITARDPRRLHELEAWLAEATEGRGQVDTQGEVLKQILALKDLWVGLLASYTCRTAAECAQ